MPKLRAPLVAALALAPLGAVAALVGCAHDAEDIQNDRVADKNSPLAGESPRDPFGNGGTTGAMGFDSGPRVSRDADDPVNATGVAGAMGPVSRADDRPADEIPDATALGLGVDSAAEAARAAEVLEAPTTGELVAHHEAGLVLARLGVERASHPALKELAREALGTEEKAVSALQTLSPTTTPTPPAPAKPEATQTMPATPSSTPATPGATPPSQELTSAEGIEFDRLFAAALIEHHERGQSLARRTGAALPGNLQSIIDEEKQQLSRLQQLQKELGAPAPTKDTAHRH